MEKIGRYEIEERLGAGAMAVVYRAVDPKIGRTVAIKTIKMDSSIGFERGELRQRLYQEAQSAGKLTHPNIVTIYDIGEEGDLDYIAMEFIKGESLQDWMVKNPIPPVEQTLAIIQQIASGLDYAASHGIIHRDIKPANILLTQDLTAKIADFGIAKIATSKLTQTGSVIGSPSYMSPEQAMGKILDGRSDIFSLGVIFYEMLTGEKPFSGTNPTTIIYKILHEEPVAPQQLNVVLHPAFNEIIGRMLAKDPDKRYQNCLQLIQDLKNYSSMTVREAAPPVPPPALPQASKSGRGPMIAVMLLIVVAVAAIAGYYLFLKPRQTAVHDSAAIQPKQTVAASGEAKKVAEDSAAPKTAAKRAASEKQTADLPSVNKTEKPEAVQKPAETATSVPAAEQQKTAEKQAIPRPVAEKQPVVPALVVSGRAEVRLEYAGAAYPVTIYDGTAPLKELSASNPAAQIAAGNHRFRIVSDDGLIDQKLNQVTLKADDVYTISVPAICSAFIDVPNDAYDGCVIQLDGRTVAAPYPAQVPRLAAGDHKIVFRWNSGKYVGKELMSNFSGEANHHYRIRGEPSGDKVVVQQIR